MSAARSADGSADRSGAGAPEAPEPGAEASGTSEASGTPEAAASDAAGGSKAASGGRAADATDAGRTGDLGRAWGARNDDRAAHAAKRDARAAKQDAHAAEKGARGVGVSPKPTGTADGDAGGRARGRDAGGGAQGRDAGGQSVRAAGSGPADSGRRTAAVGKGGRDASGQRRDGGQGVAVAGSGDGNGAQAVGFLSQPPQAGRIAFYAGLFVLGLLVGAAGALVQGGLFPGGLLLSLAGSAGLFRGGALLSRSRAGAVAPAAGWLIAVVLLTATRPEGDFLFGAGLGSYLFLLGGMAVAVMCATLAPPVPPGPSGARLGK